MLGQIIYKEYAVGYIYAHSEYAGYYWVCLFDITKRPLVSDRQMSLSEIRHWMVSAQTAEPIDSFFDQTHGGPSEHLRQYAVPFPVEVDDACVYSW